MEVCRRILMEMYESYVKQIQRYPLLDYEQEIELSKRIEQGDVSACQKLVQSNLRLVVSVAKKFASSRDCVMDLIQEGNVALMAAAAKYHYSFNTRFSTYAYTWILQYMLRYLNSRVAMISLPHRKDELLRRVTSTRREFVLKTGSEPTVSEIASCLNVTEGAVRNVLSYEYTFTSLDIDCSEEGNATMGDLLPDSTYDPEREYISRESKKNVSDLLNVLPEKERLVIHYRYNFAYDVHAKTLRELSNDLGVYAETVRQMEIRAVRRIKKAVATRPVEEFFIAC